MSSISATVTSQPITATAAGSTVSAAVTSSSSSVTIAGGVGPQGPAGTSGGPLEQLSNVQIASAQPGDVLRYGSGGKWQNFPSGDLTIDGQNF